MRNVLLFGGSGQVGTRIRELGIPGYRIVSPSHQEVDLSNPGLVLGYLRALKPGFLINMAGVTNAEQAMENPNQATLVNAFAPALLAKITKEIGIPYILASTDYIYGGRKTSAPYNEKDQPAPRSHYGLTKLLGEQLALAANPETIILRVMLPYSAHFDRKTDIARLVRVRLKQGKNFTATTDQKINPIFVDYLIGCIRQVIEDPKSGHFHLGAKDFTTPYDFALMVARELGLDTSLVVPTAFTQFAATRPAKRPRHSRLDPGKFVENYGDNFIRPLAEGIAEFAVQVRARS